jgi:rfaE bifunctional protein kinase chain/domain
MTLEQKVREGFAGKHIVVVGDAVADQFLEGTIARVSREAPVFILRHDETSTFPGGAANAAANVAALGARATLLAFTGLDQNAQALRSCLEEWGVDISGVVSVPNVSTTTKLRVLAGRSYGAHQQVIRIDYENVSDVPDENRSELLDKLRDAAESADALIASDYGYGAVSHVVFDEAKRIARGRNIPLVVDSRHRLTEFAGATTATPNREEVEQILGLDFKAEDCYQLRERLGLEALVVTNGNRGMTVFEAEKEPTSIPAVGSTRPVDVTGAGDTVIAAYTLALAAGMSFREAADIANHAGGIVVMKKGTATVTLNELLNSLTRTDGASLAQSK